jgi:hypothetical protein
MEPRRWSRLGESLTEGYRAQQSAAPSTETQSTEAQSNGGSSYVQKKLKSGPERAPKRGSEESTRKRQRPSPSLSSAPSLPSGRLRAEKRPPGPTGSSPVAEPPVQLAGRVLNLGTYGEPPRQLLDQLIAPFKPALELKVWP